MSTSTSGRRFRSSGATVRISSVSESTTKLASARFSPTCTYGNFLFNPMISKSKYFISPPVEYGCGPDGFKKAACAVSTYDFFPFRARIMPRRPPPGSEKPSETPRRAHSRMPPNGEKASETRMHQKTNGRSAESVSPYWSPVDWNKRPQDDALLLPVTSIIFSMNAFENIYSFS